MFRGAEAIAYASFTLPLSRSNSALLSLGSSGNSFRFLLLEPSKNVLPSRRNANFRIFLFFALSTENPSKSIPKFFPKPPKSIPNRDKSTPYHEKNVPTTPDGFKFARTCAKKNRELRIGAQKGPETPPQRTRAILSSHNPPKSVPKSIQNRSRRPLGGHLGPVLEKSSTSNGQRKAERRPRAPRRGPRPSPTPPK